MRIIDFCRLCGEAIRDGDSAYLLGKEFFCPGCVENARIVARPPGDAFRYRYERDAGRGEWKIRFPSGIRIRRKTAESEAEILCFGKDDAESDEKLQTEADPETPDRAESLPCFPGLL